MDIIKLKEFLLHIPKSFDSKALFERKEFSGGYQLFAVAPPFNEFSLVSTHFGNTKFAGNEIVVQKTKPVFGISYTGFYNEELTGTEINILVAFLHRALIKTNKEFPVRGPGSYAEGKYTYYNQFEGDMDKCNGTEWITKKGEKEKMYRMDYLGGIIQ